jgi:predicted RNase H-like nuclease (RuvC/YqgF family)
LQDEQWETIEEQEQEPLEEAIEQEELRLDDLVAMEDNNALFGEERENHMKEFTEKTKKEIEARLKAEDDKRIDKLVEEYRAELMKEIED